MYVCYVCMRACTLCTYVGMIVFMCEFMVGTYVMCAMLWCAM